MKIFLIQFAVLFIVFTNYSFGQFSVSLTGGGTHSPEKTTNVSTVPNIFFSHGNVIREIDLIENAKLRLDAGINYTFKNNLIAGLHYGNTSFDFSYSFFNFEKGFGSASGGGSNFISYLDTYVGKKFEIGRWKLQPYLGIGYRWSPKNNYSDYDKKIISSGLGSSGFSFSSDTINFSMVNSNINYIFPRFFIPVGLDIDYYLGGRFGLLVNLDYQYGFNKAFTRQEVMYQDVSLPEFQGLGITERKNIFSLNVGLSYTFEDVKPTSTKKKRKTLKKDLD